MRGMEENPYQPPKEQGELRKPSEPSAKKIPPVAVAVGFVAALAWLIVAFLLWLIVGQLRFAQRL
jgi:hypothetical protein